MSHYYQLTCISILQAVDGTIYADQHLKKYGITEEEWKTFQQILEFLEVEFRLLHFCLNSLLKILQFQPFKSLTAKTMDGKFPTISLCALVYMQLFKHVESFMAPANSSTGRAMQSENDPPNAPEWLQEAAKQAYDKLNKYYPSSDGEIYVIGTGNVTSIVFLNLSIYLLRALFIVLDPRLKLDWHKANFPPTIVNGYRRYQQQFNQYKNLS